VKHPEACAEWMRSEFEVSSRSELDSNPEAAKAYLLFLADFNQWVKTGFQAVPKNKRYQDGKLLQAAKGQPCIRCNVQDGTTVAAHIQGDMAHMFAKGLAEKPHDYCVADLCRECHAYMDQYENFQNDDSYNLEWLTLIVKTLERRITTGVLHTCG